MLTPAQLPAYYPDLSEESFESALASSTAASHERAADVAARPSLRTLVHNGEINTLRGNANWMRSREALISSPLFTEDRSGR